MSAHLAIAQPSPAVPLTEGQHLTVNEIIDHYLAECRNPHRERGKCKTADSIAYHFIAIREVWGTLTVGEFQRKSKQRAKLQVEAWRNAIPPTAVGTCRKRISQLKTAFKYCVEEEIISAALMPILKLPPQGAPRQRYIDPAKELPAILAACEHPDTPAHTRLCFHIALRTGQRQGAIRDLKWEHVDFDARVIRFKNTEAAEDRSKKRRTDMPMDDDLYALLREAKENADTEWVLEWRSKKAGNTYHSVRALYKRAGVSGLHRHDIRRSAATYVNSRLDGDKGAAANFLGDTLAVADRSYIVDDASVRLRPVTAISEAIAKARAAS